MERRSDPDLNQVLRGTRSSGPRAGTVVDARMTLALWLRAGRAQRGMSLEDVARITKIQIRILERLEAGKPDGLPADVFVRGFVRSVAKCVGLDEDEALKRYSDCSGATTQAPAAARAMVEAMGDLTPALGQAIARPAPAPARQTKDLIIPDGFVLPSASQPIVVEAVEAAAAIEAPIAVAIEPPVEAPAAIEAPAAAVAVAIEPPAVEAAVVEAQVGEAAAPAVPAKKKRGKRATAAGTTAAAKPRKRKARMATGTPAEPTPVVETTSDASVDRSSASSSEASTGTSIAASSSSVEASTPSSVASSTASSSIASPAAAVEASTPSSVVASVSTAAVVEASTASSVASSIAASSVEASPASSTPSSVEASPASSIDASADASIEIVVESESTNVIDASNASDDLFAPRLTEYDPDDLFAPRPFEPDVASDTSAMASDAGSDGLASAATSEAQNATLDPDMVETFGDEPIATATWQPKMPPLAATTSVPWRRPGMVTSTAPVASLVAVIDDADPEGAERLLEERRSSGATQRRSFLPPILLDREDRSARQGGLTLAVIILLIAATLTLSYLMRRPSSSGDGVTQRDVATETSETLA